MKPHSQKLYKTVQDFYRSCITQLDEIEKAIDNEIDVVELADYALMLRESADSLEALEKAIRKAQTVRTEKKLAYLQISNAPGETVATKFCKAYIDPTTAMKVPKLSEMPDVYLAMCSDLGIPDEIAGIELFRVHYPGWERWCTERAENGLPIPEWGQALAEYNTLRVKLVKKQKVNLMEGYVSA